jgi:3D (Asp-Asp-Asp) domain-containing protein
MTDIVSLALTGFFVWQGLGIAATTTPVVVPAAIHVPEKTLTVKLTAYNAVPEQTDSNPMVTASGAWTNPEVIAARSRDLAADLPFGTVIALESPTKSNSCGFGSVAHLIGYRVIADSMHERMQNKIDIVLDAGDTVMIGVNGQPKKATNPARALGVCTVKARVVGRISVKDIPETQAELALMVAGGSALASK